MCEKTRVMPDVSSNPKAMMDLSIVIPTYNRAAVLQGALAALAVQKAPESLTWEIVVVDNNSRDQTAAVVETASRSMTIPVLYVFDARQGLSHARSRGIKGGARIDHRVHR
jgi:glycosyltransferase involved in cell wall biosynthesis